MTQATVEKTREAAIAEVTAIKDMIKHNRATKLPVPQTAKPSQPVGANAYAKANQTRRDPKTGRPFNKRQPQPATTQQLSKLVDRFKK